MKQKSLVVFCNAADHFAWIASSDGPVWDIFCYNTSGTDDNVASDMNARADNGVAAEPYVVTDCDFFAVLIGGISANWMNWMASCVDCDIWCHLAVVTNLDLCNIQKSAIIVGKEIFADFDVAAVVAIKWWIDKGSL